MVGSIARRLEFHLNALAIGDVADRGRHEHAVAVADGTQADRDGELCADVVKHLAAAAAEGDRLENAEYIYRKKELREIAHRIGYLQRRPPTLKVIAEAPADPDRVFFGAFVELEGPDGSRTAYRIVGPDETDAARGDISVDSPMARALLKKTLFDEIVVQIAEGTMRYTII